MVEKNPPLTRSIHGSILVSGVPGTGKSTFGRWLELNRRFAHIDLENDGLDRFGLRPTWDLIARLPPVDVQPFLATMHGLERPVVLDWGFPPLWLPLVQTLHAAGVTAWWFDGARAAARAAFIKRGTVSVAALDRQMHEIEQHEAVLGRFYGDRVIRAIEADGTFASAESIFASIFGQP